MRKPQGYAVETEIATGLTWSEKDTFTCGHCNKIVHVKPLCDPADMGGYCRRCDKLICAKCAHRMAAGRPCKPFMQQVEEWERVGNMILDRFG